MESKIIDRREVKINESQRKMLISGWGEEVYENTVTEKITYLSDGLKVKGYIAYPKQTGGDKLPCIIWNRGGYKDRGAIDQFTARGMYGLIASWGYVVFASQYRGNDGGEGKEEIGGEDVNDILNLIPLADEIEIADTGKWGIEGWSRGGMMTMLALRGQSRFKCAVLSGVISDIRDYANKDENIRTFYKSLMGEEKFEAELKRRTVLEFTDEIPKIPYLLMHGGNDETIPVEHSLKLAEKLGGLNIPYRLVVFEGGDHFLKGFRKEVDEHRRYWFDKYLKDNEK